jgi:hypothetical protein
MNTLVIMSSGPVQKGPSVKRGIRFYGVFSRLATALILVFPKDLPRWKGYLKGVDGTICTYSRIRSEKNLY